MNNEAQIEVTHEPTWFGNRDEPLFGWLSFPTSTQVKGGVVLAPSVGFEARGARRAFRALATSLAENGFVALRFDYRGTGDSSGDFGSSLPNPQWLEDVATAVNFLRECEIDSVSGIGMRLGATLVGLAASHHQLDLTSLVMWDPCESGGSYLRELRALETLRHKVVTDDGSGAIDTAEFQFSQEMVRSVRTLALSESTPASFAKRALVIMRELRTISSSLRVHLEKAGVSFETTREQEALINVLPFFATTPSHTIRRIVEWISESGEPPASTPHWDSQAHANLSGSNQGDSIVERAVRLGPRHLFAIVSEPAVESSGPWIVMLNGIHEDHTGPSRIWVELSRRWARAGLRCVRLDVSGTGESPRELNDPPMHSHDPVWIHDVNSVGSVLTPDNPSNCVYVGMCSGAFLALHGALRSGARAVCMINPLNGTDFATAIVRLDDSSSKFGHEIAKHLIHLHLSFPWIGTYFWQILSLLLPKRWSTNVVNSVLAQGTKVYALASLDDVPPHHKTPSVKLINGLQYDSTKPYPYIYVPGLDHDMSFGAGRKRTTELLEEFVRLHYGSNSSFLGETER